MRKIIITSIAMLIMTVTYGQEQEQEQETKHKIDISIGAASPSGDFSETGMKDGYGKGYAASGVALGLDYQFNFHPNIGVNLLFRSYGYPVDHNRLVVDYSKQDPSRTWTTESEANGVGFYGIGFVGQYGGNTVKGYFNPFFGMGAMITPELDVTSTDGVNSTHIRKDEGTATGLMYGVNFGVNFRLSELISLALNFEYAAAEFEVEGEESRKERTNGVTTFSEEYDYKYDQPFSTFNTTLKLGFNF